MRTEVILEVGRRRTFASALDWPGWCRSGRDPEGALASLAAYAERYAPVTWRARHPLVGGSEAELEVVETAAGDATTDFGAPSAISEADRIPLDAAGRARLVALLGAAWAELDDVVAAAPAVLLKGPRGGGRDRDAVLAHVVDAERSYARRLGVTLTAAEWKSGHVALLRGRVCEAVLGGAEGPPGGRAWPPRYLVRRMAWHVLDHAWEIQDRSHPT